MGYRVLWYALTSGIHISHPYATNIKATIISGGGGGMGSRYPMIFNAGDIHEAYAMYGKKGGAACWDTLDPHTCTASDGETFSWPDHPFWYNGPGWTGPLRPDNPVFFTGNQAQVWYVHGPSMTKDTFKLSQYPDTPPGVTTPYVPHNFGAGFQAEINAYRHAVLGGNGGGAIGDQANPGSVIGLYSSDGYSPPRSKYWYGGCGRNALGCGGAGGALGGGGGPEQIGGSDGNAGIDLQGAGGSGAGFLRPDGSYPADQFGAGGGAGGDMGEIWSELKPQFFFHAGPKALGGAAGTGGFKGGDGSMPLVQVEEWFPDEVEE